MPDPVTDGDPEGRLPDAREAERGVKGGLRWTGGAQLAVELLRLATALVLARWMSAEAFGLAGILMVFANFANVILNFGLGTALIQRAEVDRRTLSSVFWFNLAVGVTLTLLQAGASGAIAATFGEPELVPLSRVFAVNFLLLALGFVQRKLLERELRFRDLALIDAGAAVASSVVAVGVAVGGGGPWSLVAWTLSRSAFTTLGTFSVKRWLPSPSFDPGGIGELLPFAWRILAVETIRYLTQSYDRLLVGWCLGAAALGLYEQAARIVVLPAANLAFVVLRVMFPTLSRLQGDPERLREVYLRAVRLVLFAGTPLSLGVAATARPFVGVVYGPGWSELVPVLAVLSLSGPAACVLAMQSVAYRASGRSDLDLRLTLVTRGITVVIAGAAATQSLLALAWAWVVANALCLLWVQIQLGRFLGFELKDQLRRLAGPLGLGALMGAAVALLDAWMGPHVPDPLALAIEVPVGAAVYLGSAAAMGDPSVRELLGFLPLGRARRWLGRWGGAGR